MLTDFAQIMLRMFLTALPKARILEAATLGRVEDYQLFCDAALCQEVQGAVERGGGDAWRRGTAKHVEGQCRLCPEAP